MKVEYINPFIEASKSIINQLTGLNPSLGKVYIKSVPYKGDNVVVIIGLTGTIQGNVVISFRRTLACKIASTMMMGMPVSELDEMAKSAIAELCNMILGKTASIFSQNNLDINITPPTILIGEKMELTTSKAVIICIPLDFGNDDIMEIDISYREN